MSSNILFKSTGRTTNYMPISVNTTKNEILEKYARSSFSSANDWPNDSPSAGRYDIKNSDTKLILLNEKKTFVNDERRLAKCDLEIFDFKYLNSLLVTFEGQNSG